MTTSILNSSERVQSRNIFSSYAPKQLFSQIPALRAESIRLSRRNNSYGVPSRFTQCRVLNSRDTFWLPERVVSRMHHVRGFRERSHVGAPGPRLHEETTRLARNDYRRFLLIIRPNETIFLPRPCRRILAKLSFLSFPRFARPDPISFKLRRIFHYTHACTYIPTHDACFYKYPNAWWDFNLHNAAYVINSSFFFQLFFFWWKVSMRLTSIINERRLPYGKEKFLNIDIKW